MKATEILENLKKDHPGLLNGSTDLDVFAVARDLSTYLADSARRVPGGENGRRERLVMKVGCTPFFFHLSDARATVCVILIPDGQVYCGLGICRTTETFSRRLGVTCAFGRATKIIVTINQDRSCPLKLFPMNRLETGERHDRRWGDTWPGPQHKAVRYHLLDPSDMDHMFYSRFVKQAQEQHARVPRIAYG